VQERQIDLSAKVARVKRKARPWKSIVALLLAIAAAVISHRASHGSTTFLHSSDLTNQVVAYGTAALFLVFASTATYKKIHGRYKEVKINMHRMEETVKKESRRKEKIRK